MKETGASALHRQEHLRFVINEKDSGVDFSVLGGALFSWPHPPTQCRYRAG